jgi:hypothetical protein
MEQFIKSYWEYFLELEEQFIETKRYVDFDKANAKTYSIEYLKLYQAVCSEIDVVAKEIASSINDNFKVNDANIQKWGYEIQQFYNNINTEKILFNGDLTVVPFGRWQYEWSITKDNKRKLKLVNGCQTPIWWKNYNDVKHQRIGLITGTKNFTKANQHNLILAFSALFLLEYLFMSNNFTIVPSIRNSKLFKRIVDDK